VVVWLLLLLLLFMNKTSTIMNASTSPQKQQQQENKAPQEKLSTHAVSSSASIGSTCTARSKKRDLEEKFGLKTAPATTTTPPRPEQQQKQQEVDDDDEEYAGHVGIRRPPTASRETFLNDDSSCHSVGSKSSAPPLSWAREEYEEAIHSLDGNSSYPYRQKKKRRSLQRGVPPVNDGLVDHNHHRAKQQPSSTSTTTTASNANPTTWGEWLSSSSLEFVKLAGGVTLSTTGKLVAPPLHITRTILLPGLIAALAEYIDQVTPTRAKDWFRIVSSSTGHMWQVLKNTERGELFRDKVQTVGSDVLVLLSENETRQAFMDSMSCGVKFSEALQ
jgi:hypothetical protein